MFDKTSIEVGSSDQDPNVYNLIFFQLFLM